MSVLARELDSYQRALEIYKRQLNRYNRGVDQYNNTLVKDANGNMLVVLGGGGYVEAVGPDGRVIGAALPQGFDRHVYGSTAIPGGQGYEMLRQNPIEAKRQTLTGLRKFSDEGGESYYLPSYDGWQYVDTRGWRYDGMTPGQATWDNEGIPTYNFSRDASVYIEKPAEWTKEFKRKAPDPTTAQLAKVSDPSLAQVEAGLIGEVMRGKGVR